MGLGWRMEDGERNGARGAVMIIHRDESDMHR
jgi:hypothetical protein